MTDQGFLTESCVVWETLNNIEGDTQFVDCEFQTAPPKAEVSLLPPEDRKVQEDQDYLLALSLEEENKKEAAHQKDWQTYKVSSGFDELSDEQLAMRLQAEEDAKAAAAVSKAELQQQKDGKHQQQSNEGHPAASKKATTPVPPPSPSQSPGSPPQAKRSHHHHRRSDDQGKSGKKQSVRQSLIETYLY